MKINVGFLLEGPIFKPCFPNSKKIINHISIEKHFTQVFNFNYHFYPIHTLSHLNQSQDFFHNQQQLPAPAQQ